VYSSLLFFVVLGVGVLKGRIMGSVLYVCLFYLSVCWSLMPFEKSIVVSTGFGRYVWFDFDSFLGLKGVCVLRFNTSFSE